MQASFLHRWNILVCNFDNYNYRNIVHSKVEAALYALPLFIIFAIAPPQQKPQLQQLVGGEVSALRDDPKSGCFRINLGPGSALGEKAKKIGERESGERNASTLSVASAFVSWPLNT